MERVGLIFLDWPSLLEQVELSQYAEQKGFESVWVCETRLVRDAVTPLAAFATKTSRIKLATAVVNNWTRTSGLMAMTLATLQELSGGRMMGIGSYWDPLAFNQGIQRRKTLSAMREYVTMVRKLLNLETVTYEGEVVKVRDLRLDLGHEVPRSLKEVPIYIGATGRRIHEIDMPQMMAVAMSHDAESARNTARYAIAMYMGQQPHIAKASGVDEDVIQQIHDTMGGWPPRKGGIESAMSLVGDDIIDLLCAAGTPEMCRQTVQKYLDNGASYPVLCPLTPNIGEIIDKSPVQ